MAAVTVAGLSIYCPRRTPDLLESPCYQRVWRLIASAHAGTLGARGCSAIAVRPSTVDDEGACGQTTRGSAPMHDDRNQAGTDVRGDHRPDLARIGQLDLVAQPCHHRGFDLCRPLGREQMMNRDVDV